MKTQRLLLGLTIANLVLLTFTLVSMRATVARGAENDNQMLRGSGLEIVDGQGRVRASISVLPAGTSAAGDRFKETVLLRLITERGRPSVKIGASEQSAGLSFAGPTNTRNTWVILEAKDTASKLKLRNEDGREKEVAP